MPEGLHAIARPLHALGKGLGKDGRRGGGVRWGFWWEGWRFWGRR